MFTSALHSILRRHLSGCRTSPSCSWVAIITVALYDQVHHFPPHEAHRRPSRMRTATIRHHALARRGSTRVWRHQLRLGALVQMSAVPHKAVGVGGCHKEIYQRV